MTTQIKDDIQERLKVAPYNRFLNLDVIDANEEHIKVRLPFQDVFCAGSEERGWYIHGGVIASFIDVVGDFVFVPAYGQPLPTIDLRIDYLRAAGREDLFAEATHIKKGKTLAVSNIVISNEDGRQIAVGRGLYSAQGAKKQENARH